MNQRVSNAMQVLNVYPQRFTGNYSIASKLFASYVQFTERLSDVLLYQYAGVNHLFAESMDKNKVII